MTLESFLPHLRRHRLRMTPQRMLILRIVHEAHGHLLPLQVVQQAQERMPGLTEATVYRTLSFLSGQGLILAAHVGNGQLVYEAAGHAHHHLICRECGGMQEIGHAALQGLYQELETTTGFQIDSMHVTFFGRCPACLGKPASW